MNHVSLQKHLPYAPQDIYNLIMDINGYPAIYPMVKSARVVATAPTHRDVEMTFNLPMLPGLQNAVQLSRVIGTPHSDIQVATLKSPIKTLDLRWNLAAVAQGGTQLTFNMAYETGRGFLVDMFIKGTVQNLINDTMRHFEVHAAATLTPAAAGVNRNQSPGRPGGSPPQGPANGNP